uniref:Sodium channel modifier 1 n=1 Tax=Clastoptera arizonana TaxID=38151 RepID=A0A1B6DFC2_9HEMI
MSKDLTKQLNNQRVRQMLVEYIPENEAKLLSNGKLTCLICQHRPIFDCIRTLTQHRVGKKHVAELELYLKCKSEHDYQKLKMKQKNFLTSKIMVKKKFVPKYLKRNTVLSLPSLRIEPQKSSGEHLLKIEELNLVKPTAASQVRQYLKSISRRNQFGKVMETAKDSYGVNLSSKICNKLGNQAQKTVISLDSGSKRKVEDTKTRSVRNSSIAEQELRLRMSGWIKDSSDNWIKDPNAEFDSDEEECPQLQN